MKTRNKKNFNKNTKKHHTSPIRLLIISFISFLIISIGVLPCAILLFFIFKYGTFNTILHYIVFTFLAIFLLWLVLVSEILISGVIIKLFNIKYPEGQYEYSVKNKIAFKWMLLCQIYTPIRKLLETIPMGYLKIIYLKLLGMKIGRNTLVGGIIKDPCVTEVGSDVTIGEYAIIYAHIHNNKERSITIQKVKIGNKCIVGAGAIIMPGVVMEDNAILAAGAIVTKNTVLKKNKVFGGNPAKEIAIKKTIKS
jgi:serine acetyltransferase/uncharacterized Tic20 family protein